MMWASRARPHPTWDGTRAESNMPRQAAGPLAPWLTLPRPYPPGRPAGRQCPGGRGQREPQRGAPGQCGARSSAPSNRRVRSSRATAARSSRAAHRRDHERAARQPARPSPPPARWPVAMRRHRGHQGRRGLRRGWSARLPGRPAVLLQNIHSAAGQRRLGCHAGRGLQRTTAGRGP